LGWIEIGLFFFFLWSYHGFLIRVWQINPDWLDLFFCSFLFNFLFQFYHSTLG
jgi:hypothetical protein